MTLADWKESDGRSWMAVVRVLWTEFGVSVTEDHLRNLAAGVARNPSAALCLALVAVTDGAVSVADLVPDHAELKTRLAEIDALRAQPPAPPPECSICRRRHGLEVQHACE